MGAAALTGNVGDRTLARGINRLSDRTIRAMKQPGLYADGNGLYVKVTEAGTKSWIFRYRTGKRQHDVGLGGWPLVSLADAREKALAMQRLRIDGRDPLRAKREAGAATAAIATLWTFEAVGEEYVREQEKQGSWTGRRTAEQWRQSLRDHAFPEIGRLPVAAVDMAAVLRCIRPIWADKRDTAMKVRRRIETLLAYAMACGYCPRRDNPAAWDGNLEHAGLTGKNEHKAFANIEPADMPAFMAALHAVPYSAAKALEFVILTASRAGEALGARWDEFDLERRVWTVPAERMKKRREHRVALSDAAMALVAGMPHDGDLVFPGSTTGGKMNDQRLREALRATGYKATVHGFRHTFSTWARETGHSYEVIELSLAHEVGNHVERTYNHNDLLSRRAALMNEWADHCAGLSGDVASVVPLRA
jgi:integrase